MIDIGIIGATGYTGLELLRLLGRHPEARDRLAHFGEQRPGSAWATSSRCRRGWAPCRWSAAGSG